MFYEKGTVFGRSFLYGCALFLPDGISDIKGVFRWRVTLKRRVCKSGNSAAVSLAIHRLKPARAALLIFKRHVDAMLKRRVYALPVFGHPCK